MKNNFFILIILNFLYLYDVALSESFTLNSKSLEFLKNKNQIIAYDGQAISNNKNLIIKSDKFIYQKNLDLLTSSGNGEALVNSKKIIINYDEAIFNQTNNTITANKNVKISDFNNTFKILNDEIFYDQKKNIISSDKTSKLEDYKGNIHFVDSFIFEIDKDLIKAKNLISKDTQSNIYKSSLAFINIKSGKIFGKDANVLLNNYRFKGNSIILDDDKLNITKGVFTTCKKREECSPWVFGAENIKHDKTKKEISYKNAFLKIYDKPVLYFPKFFHPDPTVKRKSGFLIPSFKSSSNYQNFLNLPFYYAVSDNKDFTFSPRLYADEKYLIQTEYRQKNLRSNHLVDFSFYHEKNNESKNHFFYKFDKNEIIKSFEKSEINFNIQQVSSDKYIKSNKIRNSIIDESDVLENSLNLNLYSNNLLFNLNTTIYENLNKSKSDRFEFILPRVSLTKNFEEISKLNGNFTFNSETEIRQYNTNIIEKENINDLIFNSNRKINRFGLLNNHQILFRNTNRENKNSNYKNKKNFYLSSIYQFNSNLPMIDEGATYKNILKPKVSLKFAPNHTVNQRNTEKKIDITNIYSLNRITNNSSIEGGVSLTYGVDYSLFLKSDNRELFNLKLANNVRLEENNDISNINQMDEKISNLFNEIQYNHNKNLSLKYTSAIKNNLKDIEYESLKSNLNFKNFITEFDYINENNTFDKNSYISNKSIFNINKFNSFVFNTRKNKTKDLTEYYNMMYQYKNDCLAASVEFNKEFYSDNELNPQTNLLFKLTIIPFGEISSPDVVQ